MKTIKQILLFAVFALLLSSCKKETGPAGPMGNANITSIIFNNPIVNGTVFDDSLPGVAYSSLASSLLLTYIQDDQCLDTWYSVPGIGCGAVYTARVFTYHQSNDTITTYLTLELRNPDGNFLQYNRTITKLRVIVAPATTIVTGKKEPVDFSDYKSAMKYFGLKE